MNMMIVQALSQLTLDNPKNPPNPNPNHTPSFFKIMLSDSSTKLRVPPAFVNNLKQKNRALKSIISLKFMEGLSWKVNMEKCSSTGFYYFTKGWSKMVTDLDLSEGDFLVFYLVEYRKFHLAVYDPTCGLKKITLANTTSNGNHGSTEQGFNVEKEVIGKEARSDVQKMKNCPFVKTLAKYNRSYCTFPIWFVRESGLCNRKKVVIMDDGLERSWCITLKRRDIPFQRYDLTTGWSEFRKDNGLGTGDTVKFKHIKGGKLKFKVLTRRS